MNIRAYIGALVVCLATTHNQAVSIPWEKNVIAPLLIAGQFYVSYRMFTNYAEEYDANRQVRSTAGNLSGLNTAHPYYSYVEQRCFLLNRGVWSLYVKVIGLAANALFMTKKVYFDGKRKKKTQSPHAMHHESAMAKDTKQL